MPYMSKRQTDNGVVPVGSNLYGTCSTGGSSQIKYVTLSDFNVLVTGVTIHVYFSYGNTASSPILQVGSTSGQYIKCNGVLKGSWESGSIISFTYDGNYWVMNDFQEAGSDTTYGIYTSNGNVGLIPNGSGLSALYLTTKSFTNAIEIEADSYVIAFMDITWQGYTPIGVVGWNISNQSGNSGASRCYPFALEYAGDNDIRYNIKSTKSSKNKVYLKVTVLFVPS